MCDRGSENFGRLLLGVLNKSIGETVAIGQGSGDRSVGDTGGRDGFYEAFAFIDISDAPEWYCYIFGQQG